MILENIKAIKEIGIVGENVLKDVFLKSTRAIKYFWKNNKLYNYINFIGMVEIFGNEGIRKAIKLMKNPKFKSKYLKEKQILSSQILWCKKSELFWKISVANLGYRLG